MPAAPARRRRTTALAVAVVALAALAGGCADDDRAGGGQAGATTSTTAADDRPTDDDRPAAAGDGFAAIPDIVEEVEPSVVTVVSDTGQGSGVVYSADGVIVTNDHVVSSGTDFTVVFADRERAPAELVATAPLLDLAVLDAERDDLPPATFADDAPRVGELAIAIGSPLGLEQTVTAGIVSGLNRSIPGSAQQTQALVNLIQTDAPISPGNSGGALVDGRGEVIGINVAYLPPEAGAVSLGFAIPSTQVVEAVEDLVETGEVSLAYIGVVPTPVTPQIARRFDLGTDRGVLVAEVSPGGPAEEAGLEVGDVIVAVGGEDTGTVEDFLGVLRRHDPGDEVDVTVLRDGEERPLAVVLSDRPDA